MAKGTGRGMQPDMRQGTGGLRERRSIAVHASRAAAWLKGDGRGWLIALAAGLFLAFSGAFGTSEAPVATRLVFWLGLMLAGSLLGMSLAAASERFGLFEQRPVVTALVIALVMTPPTSVVVWWAVSLAFAVPLTWRSYVSLLPSVLLVAAAMTMLNVLANRRPRETHAAVEGEGPPRFLERLPLKLRGAELYAVSAEDHYLRLHTSRGSDLILMRLSDAVAELEGIEGARTHRSWWVAKDAVVDAASGDGRAVLKLRNGVEAPVSRTYARALRQARWW